VLVGILGEDEQVYIVLRVEEDTDVIGNHGIMRIQTNEVVAIGRKAPRAGPVRSSASSIGCRGSRVKLQLKMLLLA